MSTSSAGPVDAQAANSVVQKKRRTLSDRGLINLFIWPTLIILIAFNVFPLFYSLFLSFTDYSAIVNTAPEWVGFENFERVLASEKLWESFSITGRYVFLSVTLELVLGFTLALFLREQFAGSGIVTTLILIPMMLSPVVVGLFWKLMYTPTFGYFNYLLGFSNPAAAPDWLASRWAGEPMPGLALWAVVLVDVWMWTPFVALLIYSGLKAIPDYLYEAAVIDRASSWFQFRRITLPQVMPLLLIAVLFRTIEAFTKSFDLIMGMTGGGPAGQTEVVAIRLYQQAFLGQFQTGRSSAFAYMVLIIIIAISNIYIRNLNKVKEG
ncbi:MAG: sugar ABC transporter permease [Candidatus Promineifilaceae bacterium]|nr:sugar ABC transporter permease [Candidatus Promineifilaceae bacterium]